MHLGLDDVAAGNSLAIEQLSELRRAAQRYETARRMNPQRWKEAWELNITTGKPFEEIIDEQI